MQNAKATEPDPKDVKRKAEPQDGPNKKPKPAATLASAQLKPNPPKPAPKLAAPTSMFAQTTALPSFKRTAAPAASAAPKVDAFAAALKAVERPSVPNAAAAQGIAPSLSRPSAAAGTKEKKAKKSVRWRPDEELVAERVIEWRGDPLDESGNRTQFAVEDGEEGEAMEVGEDEEGEEERKEMKGMMEEQEGASMHFHFDEEEAEDLVQAVEWYTPTRKQTLQILWWSPVKVKFIYFIAALDLPPTEEGAQSSMDDLVLDFEPFNEAEPFPPTPQSPGPASAEDEPLFETKTMKLPETFSKDEDVKRAFAEAELRTQAALKTVGDDQIANLLGKLQANGALPGVQAPNAAALAGLDAAALAQLGSQLGVSGLGPSGGGGSPMPAPYVPQGGGGYGYAPGFNPNAALPGGFPATPQSSWMQPGGGGYIPAGPGGYGTPAPAPPGGNPYGYAAPPAQVVRGGVDTLGHGAGPAGGGMQMQGGMFRGKRGQPPLGSKKRACRYYKTRKGCDWGDKCPYSHDL